MRMPIGFILCEYNDLLDCDQENQYNRCVPIWEDDYVDALLDDIRQECGCDYEVYVKIVWVEASWVMEVGYLDRPSVAC